MPNAPVAAAATGLPATAFNRRRMLLGLAAASSAAAIPAATAARTPTEDTVLIQLGNDSAALASAYQAAVSEREAVVAAWAPQWPSVPTAIRTLSELGVLASGIEGGWPEPYARYHTADYFTRRAAEMREPRKFRKGTNPLTIAKCAADMEKRA